MYKLIVAALFLLGLAVFSEAQSPTKLVFKKNWETTYNVNANLDAKGMNTQNGMRTGGTTSSLRATMTIRCTDVQGDSATFSMIASNAHVSDGTSNSDVVNSLESRKFHNPFHKKKGKMDKHLGHPVSFVQKETGEISQVTFNHKDKTYYNNVKMGFINALNTRVVAPGSTQVIQEKDVVGSHKSTVSGQSSTFMALEGQEMVALPAVSLKKTFDQTGFSEFPDPSLKPQNVKLQAETHTQLHNAGFIQTSTVNQVVAMVNIGSNAASYEAFENINMLEMLHESVKRQSAQDNPGDLFLSSFGSLNIVASSSPKFFLEASTERFTANFVEEETFSGDLFDASVLIHQQMLAEGVPAIDLKESLEKIFSLKEKALNQENGAQTIHLMDQVTQYLEVDTASISLLVPHLESIQNAETEQSEAVAGLCFYILSGINKKESSQLFNSYGFKSVVPHVQKAAILASHTAKIQDEAFIQSLADLHNSLPHENPHKSFALLALGSVASYSSFPHIAKDILVNEAKESYDHEEKSIDALFAIGNAGPAVFSVESELLNLNFHVHPSLRVQTKLVQVLEDFFGMDYEKDADYPFSKSKQVGFELGGKTVGAKFDAEVFLGTNFNCNQTSFNYKASGKTGVYALLFGKRKEAVGADAEYGQNGGAPLSNSAHVRVWGKTIKSMNFPGLGECKEKTYPIAHASPGFSVKYTLWVSVVPITFSASASLKLNLNWGWQLCPRDLYAEVSITPEAELVFGGDARIDLLIIKAGTGIKGSLGASIVPKAYVKGTQCLIGMEVDMIRQPLEVKMYSYAQWKKCKLIIFKCKWGTRKEHTWFKWSKEAKTQKLWNKDFKIIKGGK